MKKLIAITLTLLFTPAVFAQFGMGSKITYYTFNGPETGWGVITEKTKIYDKKGTATDTVIPGTIFKYGKIVKIKDTGDAFYGEIENSTDKSVIMCSSALAFTGSPEDLEPEQKTALTNYYRLTYEKDNVIRTLKQKHLSAAPNSRKLKKIIADYEKTFTDAEKLGKSQKEAKKSRANMQIMEQLRKIRGTQSSLKISIEKEKAIQEKWLKSHPFNEEKAKNSQEYQDIEKELQNAREIVKTMIPEEN